MLSEQISDNIYRKDPHSYWAHFLLGQAHLVEGEIDLAIAEFNQALRLNPSLQGAHEAVADLYVKKRDFDAAEAEFKKELGGDPYNFLLISA